MRGIDVLPKFLRVLVYIGVISLFVEAFILLLTKTKASVAFPIIAATLCIIVNCFIPRRYAIYEKGICINDINFFEWKKIEER